MLTIPVVLAFVVTSNYSLQRGSYSPAIYLPTSNWYSLTILNFFHFLSVGPLPLRFRQVSLLLHLPTSLPQNSNCLVSPDSLFKSQFRHTVFRSLPWLPLNKLTPTYILPIVLLCLYMSPKQNTPIGVTWELIKIQIPSIHSPDLVGLV